MRWQRPLRWGIAVAGLGFAVLLYARFERKPPKPTAPLPPKMAEGASYQSTMSPGAKQVRYKDNKEVSAVSYANMVLYTDGRRMMEKPRFEGDRDGKPFVVTADKGELKAPGPGSDPSVIPEETHLIGNVVMHEQDGMEIKTGEATYRESVATMEIAGPMAFTDGRLSGSGVGAVYDRNAQLLDLKQQAVVNMAPDESGQGRFSASANAMQLNRASHFASLEGNAQVARDHEVISADSAQLHLSDDNHGVQLMELRQHAAIVPVAGSSKTLTPEMHGDDINLEFLPDGRTMKRAQLLRKASMVLAGDTGRKQITSDLLDVQLGADGQTVTKLSGNGGPVVVTLAANADVPKRVITARQFDATSENEKSGLNAAMFKQRVVFLESRTPARGQAAVDRRVTSDELTLALNGGDLSDIKEAHFRDAVTLKNGDTTGSADDAVYKASTLVLGPARAGGRKPSVATERIHVDAKNIVIDLDKTIIDAKGEVTTQTVPDKTKAAKGLFDETQSVYGSANALNFENEKNKAVYTGAVRLNQTGKSASSIRAETLTVDNTTGDMTADENVTAVFPIENQASQEGPPKATAGKFEYTDSAHRVRYLGTTAARAQFNSPDGIIRGASIELWLSDDGSEMKRMLVDKNVEARVSADRTARGERMDYDAKAGTYVLTGSPARVIQRAVDKGVESCTESRGPWMTFKKTESDKDQGSFVVTDKTGAGTGSLNLKTCADWIIVK